MSEVELNSSTLWDLAFVLDVCDDALGWLGRVESPRAAWEQASGEYQLWFGVALGLRVEQDAALQQNLLRRCVRAGVVLVRAANAGQVVRIGDREAVDAVERWLDGADLSALDQEGEWNSGPAYALLHLARRLAYSQMGRVWDATEALLQALGHVGYAGPEAAAQVREVLPYELLERAALPLLPDAAELARGIREELIAGVYADEDDGIY